VADIGAIRSILGGIQDAVTRRILIEAFDEVVGSKSGITLGAPDHQRKATNFRGKFEVSTTATSTGEFSIKHGLETAPTIAIPVLDLGQPGAQLVPLHVTRAADGQRVYLKSTSTSARVTLLVE
jgi:hypothetical protein